mgnify:CR=1 FL=1
MQNFHKEVLTKEQLGMLPLIEKFYSDFGLVGGTAIALYLGHRRSIDFDLFSRKKFGNLKIRKTVSGFKNIDAVLRDEEGEYTIIVNGVKIKFFNYPFKADYRENLTKRIKLPDLLTLAAMKAYALGRRAKWKDYVDLGLIMKKYSGPEKIIRKAERIYSNEFNEKMFRSQLAYFKDIDYSEKVNYMPGFKKNDSEVRKELLEFSLI